MRKTKYFARKKRRKKFMHQCPKCGQEFEGKFCPECGTVWQDEKSCPNCGIRLIGSVKFCPECGYSFYSGGQPQPQQKQPSKLKQKLSAVGKWIKAHLKVVIPVSIALVALIVILSLIPTFVAMQTNGTYYACENGEIDVESYITLKNGKWSDEDGESGKYKVKGNDITIYVEFFGETEEFASGTVKNGVLTLDMGGDDCIYVSKKHKHKFDEWTVVTEATCTNEGLQTRVCACGYKEKEVIPQLPHAFDGDWHFDAINHWHYCTTCESEIDFGEHDDEDNCTICGYPFTFELVESKLEGSYYALTALSNNYPKTEVTIPSTHNGLAVKSIRSTFKSGSLLSITIPDSVIYISNIAFSKSLKNLIVADGNAVYQSAGKCLVEQNNKILVIGFNNSIIPADGSVTSIGDSAFSGCGSLTSITIPDGVTSIGEKAFEDCGSLTSVTIGNGVTSIGDYAFNHCSSLTSVTIGNGVTAIGTSAFWECSSLTSVTIPDTVASIGSSAFSDCSSLTSVTIGNGVTSIREWAFNHCTSLTSITVASGNTKYHSVGNCIIETERKTLIAGCKNSVIPTDGSVTSIGEGAFTYCRSLTTITIPNSVTKIGYCAFSDCSSLTSITIPDGVTSIGEKAFEDCSSLTSVTIGNGVTAIGSDAFRSCRSLANITFKGTKEQWNAISKDRYWNYNTGNYTVHCTDGDIAK